MLKNGPPEFYSGAAVGEDPIEAGSSARETNRFPTDFNLLRWRISFDGIAQRQVDRERTPFAHTTLRLDATAVRLDDRLRER